MQNPLENFLLNLAEKIQTEKEYKEIVKNSESVDVNKDVFAGFIEGIANTIKENVKNEPTEEKPSEPDPLENFLSTLGEKLKNLPEKKKEEETIKQEEPVKENQPVKQKEPVEEPKPVETKPENEPIKSEENETPDAFAGFVNNLANILKKTPEQKIEQPVENEKPKEQVNDYVKVLSNNKKVKTPEIKNVEKKPEENEETPDIKKFVANFVTKELESFKNDLTEKYLKKAAVLSEYAGGGGTNAVQYANGGVMNGDLNVNGHILSGGRDISNFFGNGGGGGTQTLSFNPSNADLSISGGNTVSLSALSGGGGSPTDRLVSGSFLVVLSSDGTTTIPGLLTVPNLSGGAILTAAGYDDIEGFYGQSNIPVIQNGINGTIDISNVGVVTVSNSGENYTNGIAIIGGGTRIIISVTSPGWVYNSNGSITFPNGSTQTTAFTGNPDSSKWDSNYTTTNSNSASWSSVYTNVNSNSSNYALTNTNVIFQNNVTVLGNLTAKGTATFANTIFTTTSALSVVNTGPGPALYVFQAAGPYDVASFYDGDGIEVLHVGNANPGGKGFVGINESFPGTELTVNGAISSNRTITVLGGNSNQWNSNYTTSNTNSARWESAYTSFNANSGKYDSNYTTTNSNSANWSQAYTNLTSNSAAYLSGVNISLLATTSASWNSVYSTTQNNSAIWSSVYTSFNTNSAKYDSNYTTVNSNSANWNSGYNAYTQLNSISASIIVDGGNTRASDINIGTNDNYNLFLETNNSKNVVITRTGNVGIGTPVTTIASNQDLIGYNFFSLINSLASTASPGLAASTIAAGLMTRAAGINGFASIAGWGSQGYSTGSVDIASAITNTEYYTIPIYSTQNTTIILKSLNAFFVDRSPSGPTNMGFLYGTSSNPLLANALAITPLPATPTNINTGINQALTANPITITPGTTGYMFLVPYGATAGGGRLIFQSTYPAGNANDLSFIGTITDEPYNKLIVAGTLSANIIDINMLKAQSTVPVAGTRTLTSLFLSITVGTSSLYIPLYK